MADEPSTSELARAIQEVSERASLLVREEIELAKAEMTEKVTKLLKGAVVGIAAGIFAVAALIYLIHSLSWGIFALVSDDINYVWLGYLIAGGLFDPARYASVSDQTLAWGLTPFLIGDAIKLALAALIVPGLWKLIGSARA